MMENALRTMENNIDDETVERLVGRLSSYEGPALTFMEVCGSHTAAIAKFGIRDILSPKLRLISGPGCPVCVTPSGYIDRLIELAKEPGIQVLSFGDMLRVPGSKESLSSAKAFGAKADMVYSPMEAVNRAKQDPQTTFIFAAVGFETTAPVYTLLLDEVEREGLTNVKVLTSLKTMPNVIGHLLDEGAQIDGFLAPGHVCAVTGSGYFAPLAQKYGVPFAVGGFEDKELVLALAGLLDMVEKKEASVKNFYPSIVEEKENPSVTRQIHKYFEPGRAVWRGIGPIEGSGLYLKEAYRKYDAGSFGLDQDLKANGACQCGQILMGKKEPKDCPLFGKVCRPENPQGACMVSYEGSCYHAVRSL